jgi:hypothetical protein
LLPGSCEWNTQANSRSFAAPADYRDFAIEHGGAFAHSKQAE